MQLRKRTNINALHHSNPYQRIATSMFNGNESRLRTVTNRPIAVPKMPPTNFLSHSIIPPENCEYTAFVFRGYHFDLQFLSLLSACLRQRRRARNCDSYSTRGGLGDDMSNKWVTLALIACLATSMLYIIISLSANSPIRPVQWPSRRGPDSLYRRRRRHTGHPVS